VVGAREQGGGHAAEAILLSAVQRYAVEHNVRFPPITDIGTWRAQAVHPEFVNWAKEP